MKEASGEANMTVITIVLIAAVAAVVSPMIANMLSNTTEKACCSSANGTWQNGACVGGDQTTYNACIG